ncbi:hypothetical protein FA13DRAFT_327008 [Coprinellus micaceus]|uniref:Uncharacterized protein n=1 Tax=Coprinellus micaceus TaxID=71717 RepID=A0A4Y7SDW8_COPMI|nr:hypothetical protein FA13DRAFT_327008 [Coprinellus micaceus]
MHEYRYHREAWHGRPAAAALENMSSAPPLWRWMATGISGWGMDVNPPRRMTVGWSSRVGNGIQLDSQAQDVGSDNQLAARQRGAESQHFRRSPTAVRAR